MDERYPHPLLPFFSVSDTFYLETTLFCYTERFHSRIIAYNLLIVYLLSLQADKTMYSLKYLLVSSCYPVYYCNQIPCSLYKKVAKLGNFAKELNRWSLTDLVARVVIKSSLSIAINARFK